MKGPLVSGYFGICENKTLVIKTILQKSERVNSSLYGNVHLLILLHRGILSRNFRQTKTCVRPRDVILFPDS